MWKYPLGIAIFWRLPLQEKGSDLVSAYLCGLNICPSPSHTLSWALLNYLQFGKNTYSDRPRGPPHASSLWDQGISTTTRSAGFCPLIAENFWRNCLLPKGDAMQKVTPHPKSSPHCMTDQCRDIKPSPQNGQLWRPFQIRTSPIGLAEFLLELHCYSNISLCLTLLLFLLY